MVYLPPIAYLVSAMIHRPAGECGHKLEAVCEICKEFSCSRLLFPGHDLNMWQKTTRSLRIGQNFSRILLFQMREHFPTDGLKLFDFAGCERLAQRLFGSLPNGAA